MGGAARVGAVAASILDGMVDPVVVISPEAELVWSNRACEARFGWTAAETGASVGRLIHPDDLQTCLLSFASVQRPESEGLPLAVRLLDRAGDYSWFEVRGRKLPDGDPLRGVVLSLRELSTRGRWEIAHGSPGAVSAILDALPTLALVVDAGGVVRSGNRAVTRMLGCRLDDVLARDLADHCVPEDRARLAAALRSAVGAHTPTQLEVCLLGAVAPVPVSLTIVDLVADVAVRGLLVTATDISCLVAARAELERLATHDDLTDLPNRAALRDHLAAVLEASGDAVSVVFCDVDHLKAVNDEHGHRAGDALLREVASRLRVAVGPTGFVGRLSGDEFVAVLPTADSLLVDATCGRIRSAIAAPVALPSGRRLRPSLSLGVATSHGTADADELLVAADAAMYLAKRSAAAAR